MLKSNMLKGFVCLGMLIMAQTASAEVLVLSCPNSGTLQFSKEDPLLFKVQAEVNFIEGNAPPIELYGITAAKNATSFIGADYIQNRQQRIFTFDCLYSGIGALNQEQISFDIKNTASFGLEYCYFPNAVGQQCRGDYHDCALRCEFL